MADLGLLRSYLSGNLVRLLLAASLVSIVVSASRGLWIGLGAGWPRAVRAALVGNARSLAAIVGSLAAGRRPGRLYPAGALRRRPAGPPAQQRAPVQPQRAGGPGGLERPLLGYGGPRESPEQPNAPDVGTHGQVYLVLFSHGVPGVAFFCGWWLWGSRHGDRGRPFEATCCYWSVWSSSSTTTCCPPRCA
jgi:hypothetical protein